MASITRRPAADPSRRAAVEADVLAATERLLAAGATYTELGVQRIAAEAGVARSTFYLYFRDKTELLLRLAAQLGDVSFSLVGGWSPTEPAALDELAASLLRVIRFYRDRRHVLAAVLEVAGYDRTIGEFWEEQLGMFIDRAHELLVAEQAAGRAPADLNAPTASRVMIWGGMRVIADHVVNRPADEDASVAREIAANEWFGAFRRPAA
ncbi:DNA-binding transcriptional regulator, AcrR family [Asanoa hainanensis]|uniref:DNA-binding transcriptional regulator, AcrR family n=1 Tax=Asanoa hainanensis TaxID=560556 RepID=A0A239KLI1_9ACTN|nr:TetR/AcrR family transcriptional regulator [Asanoa hainanensis]SNT18034.1 DNA-binding transcriptional regulator, AcrR family [Asanoa hainanensis]